MDVIEVPITKLKFAPYNPRVHPDQAIKKLVDSIKFFGFTNPVLVQKSSFTIIAGHARVKAATLRGMKKVPAILLDLDDEKAMAYNIADNRLQDETSFDFSGLADLLLDLDTGFFNLEMTGFDLEEIEDIMTWTPDADDVKEDNYQGKAPTKPKTKRGDLFHLGRHVLLCGDSTLASDVERLLEGSRPAVVWTDPEPGGKKKTSGPKVAALIQEALAGLAGYLDPGTACYMAAPAGLLLPYFLEGFGSSGFVFRDSLVWIQDRPTHGRTDYNCRHELILYGTLPGKRTFAGDNPDSVFEVTRPGSRAAHPAQKPMTLVARMIANHTKAGQAIADPFLGSGSTLMVAEVMGRHCRGMELDPAYCDVIIDRYAKLRSEDPEAYFKKRERRNGG